MVSVIYIPYNYVGMFRVKGSRVAHLIRGRCVCVCVRVCACVRAMRCLLVREVGECLFWVLWWEVKLQRRARHHDTESSTTSFPRRWFCLVQQSLALNPNPLQPPNNKRHGSYKFFLYVVFISPGNLKA